MAEKNIHSGHRKRMRESFLKRDFNSLHDHEILEILLFYAHPRNDTNDLAHRLINTFGSLEGVISAPYEELMKIDGVGESAAVLMVLFSRLAVRYVASVGNGEDYLTDDEIIKKIIVRLSNEPKEKIIAVLLDKKKKIINIAEIASGGIDDATFKVRALLEPVIRCGATRIVLAHNHPQGFAVPSMADVDATINIRKALYPIEVSLADHIIVAGKEWYSMKSNKKYSDIFDE